MKKQPYKLKAHVGSHWYPVDGGLKKFDAGDTIWMLPSHAAKIKSKLENFVEPGVVDDAVVTLMIVERADGDYDVVNVGTGQAVNDFPLLLRQAKIIAGDEADVKTRSGEIIDKAIMMEKSKPQQPIEQPPQRTKKGESRSLVKVHKGGGRYLVLDENTSQPVSENYFSKEQAEDLVEGRVTLEQLREAAG